MREGAATSVLSTRWRSLWSASLSCLNFDIPTMLGYQYPKNTFLNKDPQFFKYKRSQFTRWVNRVLQLRRASRLDALRVSFVLGKGSAFHINSWIKSAAAQGATEIQLEFNYNYFYRPLSSLFIPDLYEFPAQLLASSSSLKYLSLMFCILRLPPRFTGFASLVSLSLTWVDLLSQDLIHTILSKCPLLECLSISHCLRFHSNTTSLKFSGPSLRLKHLHFLQLSRTIIHKIEVHDINLLSLELIGYRSPKLSLKNVQPLARLVLYSYKMPGTMPILLIPEDMPMPIVVETSGNVPVEILFMRQPLQENIAPLWHLFGNLRRLVFLGENVINLLQVVYILEACHLLQELELNTGFHRATENEITETTNKFTTVPGICHNKLKKVELYAFEARPDKIAFAKYLLNYAVVLEKMKIHTATKVYHGNGNWSLYHDDDDDDDEGGIAKRVKSLKKVHKLLQKTATRSSIKLELSSSLIL